MAQKGEGRGVKDEELPQMDGLCDACEPDEAQPATQVCHACGFAFCRVHAERHADSTRHALTSYSCDGTQAHAEAEETSPPGAPVGNESAEAEEGAGAAPSLPEAAAPRNGANGSDAGPVAAGGEEEEEEGAESVTKERVDRLRCKEHGEDGSLYCKADEKIICVVCAVQGEHKEHEIITLREAYMWQKSREGYDLVSSTQQMGERIQSRWNRGEISNEELEVYVNAQFEELRQLVLLEEKRTLHLVDLKEAFLTAIAAEKIAEISVETEKLHEEMANITQQLSLLEQAEAEVISDGAALEAILAKPGPHQRAPNAVEARPRLPEPRADPRSPRDFDDHDSGPSMDHAP